MSKKLVRKQLSENIYVASSALAAGIVFWLLVGWSITDGYYLSNVVAPTLERTEATSVIWAERRYGEHYLLFFHSLSDLDSGIAYSNMPLGASFFLVWGHGAIDWLTGDMAPELTVLLLALVCTGLTLLRVLIPHLQHMTVPARLIGGFLAAGVVISYPYFWAYLLHANHDTVFPFFALGCFVVCHEWFMARQPSALLRDCAAMFVALVGGWMALGFLMALFFFRERHENPVRFFCATTVVCLVSVLYPKVAIHVAGFEDVSSFALERVGLDGAREKIIAPMQAVVAPVAGWRTFWQLLGPSIAVVLFGIASSLEVRRWMVESVSTGFIVAVMPYVICAVIFSQAVSIHPYLYDYLLFMPVILIAAMVVMYSMREPNHSLSGVRVLLLYAVTVGTIMTNLMVLSQSRWQLLQWPRGTLELQTYWF